ncbi:MAG: nSTAND1 domain-containing NTPase [Jatrophihabitans sp.]|uniref:nSTAND1 domain-containing NTPase n=1 Tax=Jatrophihabitans sp. TaxID=1932789 RepID=UPI003F814C19
MDTASITSRAEFVAALTALRERSGLSIRALAKAVDTPPATIGGHLSGRHLPTATQLPLLRRIVAACGVTDPAEVEAWVEALRRVRASERQTPTAPAPALPSPYRGLSPYDVADAETFFGRADETRDLVAAIERLHADPGPSGGVLAVVGPSGSGKSSLLRAGLAATADAEHADCAVLVTTPSTAVGLPSWLAELGDDRSALVVLDQAEELFTALSPDERAQLFVTLSNRPPRAVIVVGLRADFYAEAAAEPFLAVALQHAQVLLRPMSTEQLTEVIVGPAERVGASIERGLVDLVLADLRPHGARTGGHDPGVLPLLSHTLLATWEASAGGLTIAGYRATGGVTGAIQRTAEDVYGGLDDDERELARRLFLRLVSLDADDLALTRRRMSRDELGRRFPPPDDVPVRRLIDAFVARRLLTVDAGSIEITHEALLRAWPRVHQWLASDRAGLRVHRQIAESTTAWIAADRDPGLLLRGVRLQAALDWWADPAHAHELDPAEAELVEASDRNLREQRLAERRRSRRLRAVLAVVAVLAVLASVLAVVALKARSAAAHNSHVATVARDEALSREVAVRSDELDEQDPALAEQLALVALRLDPTPEAKAAVVADSSRPTITRVLGVNGPTPLALADGGRLVAVGHADDGSVHLYRAAPGTVPTPVGVVPGGGAKAQLFGLGFSPDATMLATTGQLGTVALWDVRTPSRPTKVATLSTGFQGAAQAVTFSPDGTFLAAAGSAAAPVKLWRLANTVATPVALPPLAASALPEAKALAFSPDGTLLAAGGQGGTVALFQVGSSGPPVLVTKPTQTVNALAFSPDGARLYVGRVDGTVQELQTAQPTADAMQTLTPSTNAEVDVLAVAPDGHVAVGRSDNTLQEWDADLASMSYTAHNAGPVTGLGYATGARTLFATAADGTLRVTTLGSDAITTNGTVFALSFTRDGRTLGVVSNGKGGGLRLWSTGSDSAIHALGPTLTMPAGVDGTGAITADGKVAATGDYAGHVQLWNVADPANPQHLGGEFTAASQLIESLAFSPDGTLLGVADDDHTLALWDVHDPAHPAKVASVHGGDLMLSLAFSADGHLLAGANADGHGYLWDIRDPAHPRQLAVLGGFKSYVYGVTFETTGTLLVVTSADHTARIFDINSPSHPNPVGTPLIGATDYVLAAALSPDGSTVALSSNDGSVRLYPVHDSRRLRVPLETLTSPGGSVFAVSYTPDGRELIAGGRGSQVLRWTLDVQGYASRLCHAVGTPITRQEWALCVPGAAYQPPCG